MKRALVLILAALAIITAKAQSTKPGLINLKDLKEAEKDIVLLNNESALVPLLGLQEKQIANVHFDYKYSGVFDSIANKYWKVNSLMADTVKTTKGYNNLHDKLKLFNTVIMTFSGSKPFQPGLLDLVKELEGRTNLVIVLSGKAANLRLLEQLKCPLIWYKNETPSGASLAAQLLFGGIASRNNLKENISKKYVKGSGNPIEKIRLGYSIPEALSVNPHQLKKIDSIVSVGISQHSTPGAVVLLAKDGQVIFNKAYGKHTYEGPAITTTEDIFDLASVTKVTATTPAAMALYDKKMLHLDSALSKYVPILRNIPGKMDITVREALLHEAGFTPYIKFYEKLKPSDLSKDSSAAYPTKLADNYFLRANYFNDVMWPVTLASKVETRGKFVYSDVSMYMMKEVIESITHQKLNEYLLKELYFPLGLQTTGFLPRNRFDRSRIVPTTENDNWLRNMLVQGYVNDPGAAMAGGVEGHAGLFSNANDLAIYYQMLLNKGSYGAKKYFDSTTVNLFTSRQSKTSWRGLGFDRANPQPGTIDYRSEQAFGHSGYTGTLVWVDPKYKLVYICLTNRVYPDDGKTYGPSKVNIRSLALEAFYKAILDNINKS